MIWHNETEGIYHLSDDVFDACISWTNQSWFGIIKYEGRTCFNVVSSDLGWAKSQLEQRISLMRKLRAEEHKMMID